MQARCSGNNWTLLHRKLRHRTPSLWLSFEIRQIKSKAATSVTTLLKTPKTSIASDWKWLYSKEDNTHLSSNRNHGYRYHTHSDNGVCSYCYRYVHPIEREYKIDIIRLFFFKYCSIGSNPNNLCYFHIKF